MLTAIWGVVEPKPLAGWPPGRVRLRIRNDGFVTAVVRTATSARRFYVMDTGTRWAPSWEIGANIKTEPMEV
jgi:hypothetical protein